jgi:cytochrome c-type biogenesis protein CcmH/NrfG
MVSGMRFTFIRTATSAVLLSSVLGHRIMRAMGAYRFAPCLAVVLLLGRISCLSQVAPSPPAEMQSHSQKAKQYLSQNRPDLALREFRAMVALDPNNADARGNLGVLLFFQGDYGDAIPEFRIVLKEEPLLSKIQALLGIAEKRTGDISAGRQNLEQAFPKVQDKKIRVETGMELIEIYSATGDLDKAAVIVADLRRIDPTNENVLYTAYRIYSDLSAESIIGLSLVNPASAQMNQAMAHELAKRGSSAEAIASYRAAIKLDPHLPGIHFELAEMLRTLSTAEGLQESEKEYKTAVEENPFDEQSLCRLGDIAFERGDYKGAGEVYRRALQLRPNDPEANVGLAKVVMERDEPQKAEPLLEHALQADPTNALAHFRLSTVYRQTGRLADAKREVQEYQKYKAIKEKLRTIYHDLHEQQGADENQDSQQP